MRHKTNVLTAVMLGGTLAFGAASGCAARTTKTTQTVTAEAPAAGTDEAPPRPAQRTETTTTTTTESDESSPGIVGSAFGLVWAVVSFPFRVIGALF